MNNTIKIKWHGALPDNKNIDELELLVFQDIKKLFDNFDTPSNLVFHTVFVGKTMQDEIVSVWGELGDDTNIHCEYVENPEWVSLKQLEQDEMEKNASIV
jgi:hypothetical protein